MVSRRSNGADNSYEKDLALRKAAANGYFEIVKYLIERGADVFARGESFS
jgi:ankyrin repeat protein